MIAQIGLLALILSVVINAVLGYMAYSKNPSGTANRLFGLLCLSLIGWTITDFLGVLGVADPVRAFAFIKIALMFVALQNLCFFLLLGTFPGTRLTMNRLVAGVYTAAAVVAIILPFTGSFFATYDTDIVPSVGMMLWMVILVFSIISGFVLLGLRLKRQTGQARNQVRYLVVAAIIVWVLIPITDFILPNLPKDHVASQAISPIVALLFALTLGYAIIRQRLFDVRPLAARSLAYGLFILTLVVAYVLAAFAIPALLKLK